jgi:hypothetical protein
MTRVRSQSHRKKSFVVSSLFRCIVFGQVPYLLVLFSANFPLSCYVHCAKCMNVLLLTTSKYHELKACLHDLLLS